LENILTSPENGWPKKQSRPEVNERTIFLFSFTVTENREQESHSLSSLTRPEQKTQISLSNHDDRKNKYSLFSYLDWKQEPKLSLSLLTSWPEQGNKLSLSLLLSVTKKRKPFLSLPLTRTHGLYI
jgi:hypothetical protein